MQFQTPYYFTYRITTDPTPDTPVVTQILNAAPDISFIIYHYGISLVAPMGGGGGGDIEYDGGGGAGGGCSVVHASLWDNTWYDTGNNRPVPQDANMFWLSISCGQPSDCISFYPQGIQKYNLGVPGVMDGGLSINHVCDVASVEFDVTLVLAQIQGEY